MNSDPFPLAGSPRDREEALFSFLAEHMAHPNPTLWQQIAQSSGRQLDLGFAALLLHSLVVDRVSIEVSGSLYGIAESLLGPRLTVSDYERWLRHGWIDVPRLASFLDMSTR
ncbi:hypothetical protein OOZ63_20960 [Paucibacter sp. PLA-PC-4]|uniref:hypothetical protein n=1 Tax=Paucibacter sp. PLA-PC-4 TaxID=2993655 RepID=UPI00224ABFB0|nr:hypothetical protein [Paucibacter sp. PLA-PC-4]MCX2864302.1 hypothetical protein [Paucibacter sp. PLA-PC-4]